MERKKVKFSAQVHTAADHLVGAIRRIAVSLREDVLAARGVRDCLDLPLARPPFAGERELESFGGCPAAADSKSNFVIRFPCAKAVDAINAINQIGSLIPLLRGACV